MLVIKSVSAMVKITVVLKNDDKFIVKKDYFKNDYFYGFWELGTHDTLDQAEAYEYITQQCYEVLKMRIKEISYVISVENPVTTYLFYLVHLDSDLSDLQEEYEIVCEEQLASLNIIYPDAFCRDCLTGQTKTKSEREKEILLAADKLFNINENAARADAFIALMDNRIAPDEFEKYMRGRERAYRYGMPDFGFADDVDNTLYIWKKPDTK